MEAKLTDVCDIQYGYAFDSTLFSETEGTPLIRIRDVIRGFSETRTTESFLPEYTVHNGDILIGMDGEFNIARWHGGTAALNQRVCRLIPKKVDADYIFHFMPSALKAIEAKTPFVTVKHLSAKELNKITVPIPALDEQIRIGTILNHVLHIIEIRKRELQSLDNLIKARFVEMFGTLDLALQNPDWIQISQIGIVVGGSTPKTNIAEYWDGEYRWISPAELKADSGIIYDSVKKITKAGIDSCSLQELPVGTVILSSRAPIGKVAIAGNTFYCNQGFKNIICNEKVLPRYLYTLLLFNTEYLNSLGRGATFKEISKSIVENIRIPLPSIDMQKQFEAFVSQVDKSKVAVQKALDQAQLLFDSLMQKYFG